MLIVCGTPFAGRGIFCCDVLRFCLREHADFLKLKKEPVHSARPPFGQPARKSCLPSCGVSGFIPSARNVAFGTRLENPNAGIDDRKREACAVSLEQCPTYGRCTEVEAEHCFFVFHFFLLDKKLFCYRMSSLYLNDDCPQVSVRTFVRKRRSAETPTKPT